MFTGIAAHVIFGANLPLTQGQTTNGEGMLVSGSYFPCLACSRRWAGVLGAGDDHASGVAGRGAQPRLLEAASAESRRPERTMIVNGQTLTIVGVAPRGFNGTTLGASPEVFVSDHDARHACSRASRASTLGAPTGPTCSAGSNRASSIEQATAALNEPYQAIINDVEAPLQKGMSDQTMVRFRAESCCRRTGTAARAR